MDKSGAALGGLAPGSNFALGPRNPRTGPERGAPGRHARLVIFFKPTTDRRLGVRLRDLAGYRVVSISSGLLVLLHKRYNTVRVLHPFFDRAILLELPNMAPTLRIVGATRYSLLRMNAAVLTTPASATTSTIDAVVAWFPAGTRAILFAKPGDVAWDAVVLDIELQSVLAFRGRLYATTKTSTNILQVYPPTNKNTYTFPVDTPIPDALGKPSLCHYFLVESDGRMLLAVRHYVTITTPTAHPRAAFKVFEVDLDRRRLEPVSGIGDRALVLGTDRCLSVSDAGPLTFAGNNPEGFAWLGPLPHLDQWRKHYRSFYRDGMRISVHDFIYIQGAEGTESHVAYVEDLYEDGSENRMVLARWLDKPGGDHGVAMPPDVHDREVFFSYVLQDVGVNWVEGLAPVLNYQHFEWFQRNEEEHSKWKPYLCQRQIVGTTLEPFNITQLQGYANQEIVQALFREPSSMAVHSTEPNKGKTDGGQKRKHDEINKDQLVQNPAAPGNVNGDRGVETNTTLIAVDTVKKLPPCNATNDQTVQKLPRQNVTSKQTGKNNDPVNAPKTGTVANKPSRDASHAQAVVKLHPSGGSASDSGLLESVVKPNANELFNLGCRIEALSQDSGIGGCWFTGVIVKKKLKDDLILIKVKYQDIRHAEGRGHLKEWLKLQRTAQPDKLGIRLTGRPMIRPSPSNLPNTPSPVTVGTVVDVRLQDGWWEGVVVEPKTVSHVRVYFPGERIVREFVKGDLRRSFEWVGDRWLNFMPRKDIILKGLKGERSAKPVLPIAILESMQVGGISLKPAAQNTSSQQSSQKAECVSVEVAPPRPRLQSREKVEDEAAKPAPQKTILHCSIEELGLQSGKKGHDDEPAKPAADKVSLQYSQEGGGITVVDGLLPDAKRPRVDLTNFLKSKNVLKWAERKARGSGPLMGYSDGSSQEGSSAPNGDTEPVNSAPAKEECKNNEQAPASTAPPTIDLSDDE
ncbi:hypothetical protein ACQ4PT_048029 [Festuca glaucescens]